MAQVRLRGAEGFQAYYEGVFGPEWPRLRAHLIDRPAPLARLNTFAETGDVAGEPSRCPGCIELPEGSPSRDGRGLLQYYVLDEASVWAARALEVQAGQRVLDLCAAPGGKMLLLAEALAERGELVANDRSAARVQRLRRVVADYLPEDQRARVQVTQRDGRRVGLSHPESFDRVLVDAPCSSERHVLTAPGELAKWSEGRIGRLTRDQYALLTSAWLALRPGGKLVYCTCALAPPENGGVIERLIERGRHPVRVEPLDLPVGKPLGRGWQILPHRDGCGPLFLCRLVKDG